LDFLAILFFIGFLILQSIAESKRKQKAREQAERRRLPEQPAGPAPARELPVPFGGQKPEVHEREEPPAIPETLPWELPWELDEEEEEKEREIVSRPPQVDLIKERPVVAIVEADAKKWTGSDWRQIVFEEESAPVDAKTIVLPRFTYEVWTQGIIMAEVLQPPRTRRRTGYPSVGRKVV